MGIENAAIEIGRGTGPGEGFLRIINEHNRKMNERDAIRAAGLDPDNPISLARFCIACLAIYEWGA
jgi:hypothetical protein